MDAVLGALIADIVGPPSSRQLACPMRALVAEEASPARQARDALPLCLSNRLYML